jgi:hypothetical protein
MVTMATKLFTAVNSVKLSYIELNEVKVSSLILSSIKSNASTSNKLHVRKIGKLVLSRTYFLPVLYLTTLFQ